MSVAITGKTRHRLLTMAFRPPVFVLQVQVVIQQEHAYPHYRPSTRRVWRDAVAEDFDFLAALEAEE